MKKAILPILAAVTLSACTVSTNTKYAIGIGTPKHYDTVSFSPGESCQSVLLDKGYQKIVDSSKGTTSMFSTSFRKDNKIVDCLHNNEGLLWHAEDWLEEKRYFDQQMIENQQKRQAQTDADMQKL